MPTNYYVFTDRFTVPCDIETAWQYISNIEDFPRWWGRVYKKIVKLRDAPKDMAGAQYRVTVGGFLPYTLTIQNEVTFIDKPKRIDFIAWGDLEGKGSWLFREVAEGTEIVWDWRVAANKAVIRWFSFLLKPVFRANHAFCVRKANEGIRKDLAINNPSMSFS